MPDDPMFDYILARSRTRESSTLTVATVASSASLVLIALFIQLQIDSAQCNSNCDDECDSECGNKCEIFHDYDCWLKIMGIIFAVVGILYREITKKTIHDNDEQFLRYYVKRWREYNRNNIGNTIISDKCVNDPLNCSTKNWLREILIRSLLLIPVIAWSFIHECDFNGFQIDAIIFGIALGFTVLIIGFGLCESKEHND